jgi:hypothetical protein
VETRHHTEEARSAPAATCTFLSELVGYPQTFVEQMPISPPPATPAVHRCLWRVRPLALPLAMALTIAPLSGCSRPAPVAPAPVAPAPVARAAEPEPTPVTREDSGPAPAPLLAIDWAQVKLDTDADALAVWAQIAPTGADWQLRLGELPADDTLRRKLAFALLRAGNFTCRPAGASACAGEQSLEAAATATLDDPCLRRELAMWSIDQLDDTDAAALEPQLVALAALPPPESALVTEAFDLVPVGADALLLRMVEAAYGAGQGAIADESLHWLPAPSLLQVATTLHADGAFASLDPVAARAAFLAAITDAKLRPATSIAALEELSSQDQPRLRKDLRAAMAAATKDPRCEVAAAAARALVISGEPRFAPRPVTSSLPAALRSLCVMAAYVQDDVGDDPALRRFISKKGLQIYDHSEITADPDLPTGGELIMPAELVTLPFLEELASALEHCEGTTCRTTGLRFELAFEPDRSLRRISRFADAGSCP